MILARIEHGQRVRFYEVSSQEIALADLKSPSPIKQIRLRHREPRAWRFPNGFAAIDNTIESARRRLAEVRRG